MAFILDKRFSSVLLSHFTVDVMVGERTILLTWLAVSLGMSNARLGLFATAYLLLGGILQPVFGWIADKIGERWLIAGAIVWLAVFCSLVVIIPGETALYFLVLASLGNGAFHPAGTTLSVQAGQVLLNGKETTATSYFFLFGQSGWLVGPILAGLLLEKLGPHGLLLISAAALPVAAISLLQLRNKFYPDGNQEIKISKPAVVDEYRPGKIAIAGLLIAAAAQAWVQQNVITFMPKYVSDLGQPATVYGIMAAIFMGGSAIGNVIGGILADRFGKKLIICASLVMAAAPLIAVAGMGVNFWLFALVFLSGFFTGAAYSVIVVLAKRLIPSGNSFSSGLVLAFIFSSGALGGLLSGILADQYGFTFVFSMTAVIALTGALFGLLVKENSNQLKIALSTAGRD